MVEKVVFDIIIPVFTSCATWTDQLFKSVQGNGFVLAAFLVCLVIGLLFIPMRGGAATGIKAYREKKIHAKNVQKKKDAAKAAKKGG